MKILLDTHLLLWAAGGLNGLSKAARTLIEDPQNELFFSVVSLWEIALKRGFGRPDFMADPHVLRRELLESGYGELLITGDHALAIETLPPIHKDRFDRMLIAQALTEGITLLTVDSLVAKYPCPVRRV